MRKMGVYLGLLEDTERFDDEYDEQEPETRDTDQRPVRAVRTESAAAAPVAHLSQRRRPTASEMSRITTLHPRTYNEARTIGEHFREGIPVIMNLSEMDDNDAKRLVDFAAGLVFAVHGTIERVTSKVFLLSPPNVTVAAEDKQLIAEGGFFNQS
jgi:cell division inhibitor SepF